MPGVYLDFYRFWAPLGVPLEPAVVYAKSIAAVPLLVAAHSLSTKWRPAEGRSAAVGLWHSP